MQRPTQANRFLITVAVVALGAVLLAGCMGGDESTAFAKLNTDRVANGVPALASNATLVTKAQAWAKHLAAASGGKCTATQLVHSNLTDGAPVGWHALGENIACATTTGAMSTTIATIENGFMGHAPHKANIVNPSFNNGAIGLASVPLAAPGVGIVVFEVQDFAGL